MLIALRIEMRSGVNSLASRIFKDLKSQFQFVLKKLLRSSEMLDVKKK